MFSPLFLLLLTLALGGFWCDKSNVTYLQKTINSIQFNSCCWDKIKLQSVWLLKSSHLILSAFCKNLMFKNYWNCGNMILRMLLHVCCDGWNANPDYSTGYGATLTSSSNQWKRWIRPDNNMSSYPDNCCLIVPRHSVSQRQQKANLLILTRTFLTLTLWNISMKSIYPSVPTIITAVGAFVTHIW